MSQKKLHNYLFYGTEAYASEIEIFLNHVFQSNAKAEEVGKRKVPICIWGFHGIGKTELVESFAKDNGYNWSYIAPAQFEEMGDLLGMPVAKDGKTIFSPPEWVPTKEGKGILLIDDVNRADDRILRGIMQLLQNYELASWSLPKGWQIVLTANPDGGDYSVTPIDDAMLTRMMHITMRFDIKEWAKWAEKNQVDPRGINFILTYPELIHSGERTTPRSLVQFFQSIEHIEDLEKDLGIVQILADSCLDKEAVTAFIAFVRDKLGRLPSPSDIMDATSFEEEIQEPVWEMVNKSTLRVDLLSTLCTRLVNYLLVHDKQPSSQQLNNIKSFMLMEFIPNDLRLGMAQDFMKGNTAVKSVMADPELSMLMLENM
jgi:hypothetical protein